MRLEYLLKASATVANGDTKDRATIKAKLLDVIDSTPSNMPTSKSMTDQILEAVRSLEEECPTATDDVLEALGGNWELLWTAQDQSDDEFGLGMLRKWIR